MRLETQKGILTLMLATIIMVYSASSIATVKVDGNVVGSLNGELTVTPSGSASYIIPIETPKGIGGMHPGLSLTYDSQGGNNYLGVGWQLSGLSVISRCPRNHAIDNIRGTVEFSNNDRLCLDGKRLVLVSGSYWGNDSEYRTEQDSFTSIKYKAGVKGSFTASTKSGEIFSFGVRNKSYSSDYTTEISSGTFIQGPKLWAIDTIQDAIGNKIYIDYVYDLANGEQHPEIIYYSAEGCNNDPDVCGYRIEFDFQPGRKDVIKTWYRNNLTTISKLLKNINIYFNNQLIKQYKLTYDYEPYAVAARSRLTSVQHCAKNDATGSMDCMPPTMFEWTSTPGWESSQNISWGNYIDSKNCVNGQRDVSECETDDNYYKIYFPDLNGDAKADMCYRADAGMRCRISTGNGTTGSELWEPLVITDVCRNKKGYSGSYDGCDEDLDSIEFVDINGDGRDELVYRGSDGIMIRQWTGSGFTLYNATQICPDHDKNFGVSCTYLHYDLSSESTSYARKYKLADINGDSLVDICYRLNSGITCRLNNGNSQGRIWGTQSDTPISTSICSDGSVCGHDSVTLSTWQFADANGDGKSDIFIRYSTGLKVFVSTGNSFTLHIDSQLCKDKWKGSGEDTACNDADNHNYLYFPDLNGDGLADFCYRGDWGIGIVCRILNGAIESANSSIYEKIVSVPACFNESTEYGYCFRKRNWSSISFVDINADGFQDLVYRGDHGIRVWLFDGNTFTYLTTDNEDICAEDSKAHGQCNDSDNHGTIQYPDINGDGKPDLAYRSDKDGISAWIVPNIRPTQISKITNGLGAASSIVYSRMNNSGVYERTASCVSQYPILCPLGSSHLVSSVSGDNGIGGQSVISYHYKDLRVHMRGRGALGFNYFSTFDEETKIRTINEFDNTTGFDIYPGNSQYPIDTYPYAGMAVNTKVQYEITGTPVTTSENFHNLSFLTLTTGVAKTYFTFVEESQEYNYEMDGSYFKFVRTSHRFDSYGNATRTDVETKTFGRGATLASNPDGVHISITNNKYFDPTNSISDLEEQRYGRLYETSVYNQLTEDVTTPETRTTRFKYFESGPHKHMLKQTIEEPDDPKLMLVTDYTYDAFGNQNSITLSGAPGMAADPHYSVQSRTATTEYDYTNFQGFGSNAFIKVVSTQAANTGLALSDTTHVDPRHGSVKYKIGPNGTPTFFEYDGFGRPTRAFSPGVSGVVGDTETITEYHWCQSDASANCSHFATYYVKTTNKLVSGALLSPPTKLYYDKLGREVRTETLNFNKRIVLKDIQYDKMGNVWRESRNYFAGSIPQYWKTYTYDDFGRAIRIVNPDGSIVTTEYNGNEVAVIRERRGENGYTGIRQFQSNSVMGKVRWVIDSIGNDENQTLYHYTPFGDLAQTTDAHGNVTSMTYDKRGRKISMDDPDMGKWEYRNDALGNLRWQMDNKGQTVETAYDILNRPVQRNESTGQQTTWEYHDANASKGSRGKLFRVSNSDSYQETVYDSFGRIVSEKSAFKAENQTDPDAVFDTARNDYFHIYTTQTVYDTTFPRVDYVVYPKSNDNGASKTLEKQNIYDSTYGFLIAAKERNTSNEFWKGLFANADNRITLETTNNGKISTARSFYPATGLIKTISTGTSSTNANIQNLEFYWDSIGNLEKRIDHNRKLQPGSAAGVTERFNYDGLNRLLSVFENNTTAKHYQYDRIGNMTFNSDVGYYRYENSHVNVDGSGPHAVTRIDTIAQVSPTTPGNANADNYLNSLDTYVTSDFLVNGPQLQGNANCEPNLTVNGKSINLHDVPCIAGNISKNIGDRAYTYDKNGNVLTTQYGTGPTAKTRTITWTRFNKPARIEHNGATIDFEYGPTHSRFRQIITEQSKTTTIHYAGPVERISENGVYKYRNYISAGSRTVAVIEFASNAPRKTNYLHVDYMGSTDAITNENNVVVDRFSFDPFGKRRAAYWNDGFQYGDDLVNTFASFAVVTARWFTGHEQLQTVGLIHMNGRVYDPEIGRFLSADPHVQFIHDGQSFNRYSYVLNNPLSFTDPSGYFLSGFFDNVHSFMRKYGRSIAAIAIVIGTAGAGTPMAMMGGFFAGYISSGGDLRAAVTGALVAGALSLVGDIYSPFAKTAAQSGQAVSAGIRAGYIAAHALVGGAQAKANGEKFISGFSAAGASTYANVNGYVNNVVAAIIVGGTASVIGGGKFANGAVTGAFSYMFGEMAQTAEPPHDILVRTGGRTLNAEQLKQALSEIRDSLLVDPQVLIEGANGAVLYNPANIIQIYDALSRLANSQGESFLKGAIFGPERSMFARVILGKGDSYTSAWFHHEVAEALYLEKWSHLPNESYVNMQEVAHIQVLNRHQNSSTDLYHPSVVRAYNRHFGPLYPRY